MGKTVLESGSPAQFFLDQLHQAGLSDREIDGSVADVRTVLLEELIPLAREGLRQLAVGEQERDRYLDVVASRVRSGQNGATWQRAFVDRHGRDFFRLTAAYLEHQRSAMPVHEWSV